MTVAAITAPDGVRCGESDQSDTANLDRSQALLEAEIHLLKVTCFACNKTFSCMKMLLQHRQVCENRREDPKTKQYKCDQCSRSFRSMTGLRNHLRTHIDYFAIDNASLISTPGFAETSVNVSAILTVEQTERNFNGGNSITLLDMPETNEVKTNDDQKEPDLDTTYTITSKSSESPIGETKCKKTDVCRKRRSGIPVALSKFKYSRLSPSENNILSRIRNKSGTPCDKTGSKIKTYTPRSRSRTPMKHTPGSRNRTPLSKKQTPHSGKRDTPKGKIHRCKKCGKTFIDKTQLDIHYTIHTRETPKKPTTPSCLKKKNTRRLQFKIETEVYQSPSTIDQQIYSCTKCSRTYDKERYLISHMKTHEIDRPYTCVTCDKKFKYATSMKAHSFVHYGEGRIQNNSGEKSTNSTFLTRVEANDKGESGMIATSNIFSMTSNSSEKQKTDFSDLCDFPYACKSCDFKTREPAELLKHMRCHNPSKNKQFRCDTCQKSYSSKETLALHSKVHTIARLRNMLTKKGNNIINSTFNLKAGEKNTSTNTH